ncbi:MAG: hypothetical protein OHK0040_07520 [bacterium]
MLEQKDLKLISGLIDVVYSDRADEKSFETALLSVSAYLNIPSIWINLWEGSNTRLFASVGISPELKSAESFCHSNCQCKDLIRKGDIKFKIYRIKNCKYLSDKSVTDNLTCHFTIPLRTENELIGTLNFGMEKEKTIDEDLARLLCKIFSTALANRVYCKRMEEQRELLSKRNKDMEVFVSAVSHDMKTPIIAVKGFINLINKKYKEKLPKELNKYIYQIEKGVDRIEELVKDLLNLSRVEKVLTKRERISLDEVLQASLKSIRPLIRHRKPKIKIIGERPIVIGNWLAFFQIFTNLIANAIKYTPDDRKPEVKVFINQKDEGWLFIVSDNGIGLTDKERASVFEPFTKVKTLLREGSGVGLSIVKRIVEGLGGKIWLESEKGKGSSFYIYLPTKEEENAEGETRTRTGLTPLDPEPSVSASSTTSAS